MLSRRSFLILSGVIGGGLLGGLGRLDEVFAKGMKKQKWPWPYEKLDPEKTAEIAYNEYYRIACGGAVISAIFPQLAEKIGDPYASFPVDAFFILESGVAGWGTLCGPLAGAAVVANCICGPKISGSEAGYIITNNLIDWYANTALPVYKPKNPKANKEGIVQTTSNSPLCHISVGKWMKATGYAFASPERRDRCARVAASVAYQLVLMLNAWKDGEFNEKMKWTPARDFGILAQQNCLECHGSNVPEAPKLKK
ncbi:MAG: C-GCAxxG-C-C family (seleno)protein [Caldimicrobium sp.]|jgi:hypothetical protein